MTFEVTLDKSRQMYEKAKTLIPGGVSSPVRAIKPYPFYTASADGSKIRDLDGNEYIRITSYNVCYTKLLRTGVRL